MASVPPGARRARPKYYDLNLLHLPPPGLVSILHRVTGVAMLLFLIPFLLFVLQVTLSSADGFAQWQDYFAQPLMKVIVLGFIWSYLHHLFAGIRYLLLDLHLGAQLVAARASANLVLIAGVVATALIAVRIW